MLAMSARPPTTGGAPARCTPRMRTHLGRDVVRRPAERLRRLARKHALLAHAEVCDLAVALLVQQDVVEL